MNTRRRLMQSNIKHYLTLTWLNERGRVLYLHYSDMWCSVRWVCCVWLNSMELCVGLNLDLMFSFSGSRVPFPDSVFSWVGTAVGSVLPLCVGTITDTWPLPCQATASELLMLDLHPKLAHYTYHLQLNRVRVDFDIQNSHLFVNVWEKQKK